MTALTGKTCQTEGLTSASGSRDPLGRQCLFIGVAHEGESTLSGVTPYRLAVSDEELADLRRRLARTRWPERETVDDWSQGIPLGYMRELCEYWERDYDWRRIESQLNAFEQVRVEADGLDFHVIHARSPEPDALPIVMTHGWPGSIVEFLQVLGPLTDPVRYGGKASDAFHLVCPSLPGYGFSDKPAQQGWGCERTADAWATIMSKLGYETYGVQGGDWGATVSAALCRQHTENTVGLYLSSATAFPGPEDIAENDTERAALERVKYYRDWEAGYAIQQMSRPQTVGYGLVDSPAGLAAWIVEKVWAFSDYENDLSEVLSADQLLDNVMMHWLPRAGASAGRFYWESYRPPAEKAVGPLDVPMGMTIFPKEITRPARRWVERDFSDVRYWSEASRGGHFPAWEQPEIFVEEFRAFFRLVR